VSAQHFQTVMANLIRFPTTPLSQIKETLGKIELTEKEERQLEKMSHDPLVRKFGYKMSLCRRRDATEVMKLSIDFIEPEILDEMYYKHFEPTRKSTDLMMLGVQFLQFALDSEACMALLKDSPPFVKDLMKYDLAKAAVLRMVVDTRNQKLPPDSLLFIDAFTTIEIGHDAPALDQMKQQDPKSKKKPKERNLVVLFMRAPLAPYYRMFQIDEEVSSFLKAQRENPASWTAPLPKPYAAMAKVGLVRDLEAESKAQSA